MDTTFIIRVKNVKDSYMETVYIIQYKMSYMENWADTKYDSYIDINKAEARRKLLTEAYPRYEHRIVKKTTVVSPV